MVGAQDWPNIRPLASETLSGSMRLRANGAFRGISSLVLLRLQTKAGNLELKHASLPADRVYKPPPDTVPVR